MQVCYDLYNVSKYSFPSCSKETNEPPLSSYLRPLNILFFLPPFQLAIVIIFCRLLKCALSTARNLDKKFHTMAFSDILQNCTLANVTAFFDTTKHSSSKTVLQARLLLATILFSPVNLPNDRFLTLSIAKYFGLRRDFIKTARARTNVASDFLHLSIKKVCKAVAN